MVELDLKVSGKINDFKSTILLRPKTVLSYMLLPVFSIQFCNQLFKHSSMFNFFICLKIFLIPLPYYQHCKTNVHDGC